MFISNMNYQLLLYWVLERILDSIKFLQQIGNYQSGFEVVWAAKKHQQELRLIYSIWFKLKKNVRLILLLSIAFISFPPSFLLIYPNSFSFILFLLFYTSNFFQIDWDKSFVRKGRLLKNLKPKSKTILKFLFRPAVRNNRYL